MVTVLKSDKEGNFLKSWTEILDCSQAPSTFLVIGSIFTFSISPELIQQHSNNNNNKPLKNKFIKKSNNPQKSYNKNKENHNKAKHKRVQKRGQRK